MVVIDASIAYKWFAAEETDFERALLILKRHIEGTEKIIAPKLLLLELTNAWVTKTGMSEKKCIANLNKLEEAKFYLHDLTFLMIKKVLAFAKKYHVTAYDAAYAVLAKEKRCWLITSDRQLLSLHLPFIKNLTVYTG